MDDGMKKVLVVAAHPDDEVLGCGGTIARLSARGCAVQVAFLADGVGSRGPLGTPPDPTELAARRAAGRAACEVLGLPEPVFGDLPDNQMDAVPLLTIAQAVEDLVARFKPDAVFTHHAGDLNIDHRLTHQAVVTACRPLPGRSVRKLLFFEVPSSTEWQAPGSGPAFAPQVFVDITEHLPRKLAALRAYEAEMRPWPHARSLEAVEHLARWRGASAGMQAAEAFMLGRDLIG